MIEPTKPLTGTGNKEFIALMALLMSLLALSIDSVLPALGEVRQSFQLTDPNKAQWLISSVFFGMALGLIIYGPLSDSFGRKKIFYIGVGIFLLGDLIALLAADFNTLLLGRVLQGFGAASCRVLTIAMIRDKYQGRDMARIMSLIMMVFILVPVLAPSVGQLVLLWFPWRAIFVLLFIVAVIALLWLYFRQPETLPCNDRPSLVPSHIVAAMVETLSRSSSRNYMLASGLIFGAFVGYLSSAQQILQVQYQLGDWFAMVFGALALAIGVSSYANSMLVMKFKLHNLCVLSLIAISVLSLLFLFYLMYLESQPSLSLMLIYLALVFFNFGILFGNLNTLALIPLGHIAGTATSCISSVQTLISIFVGGLIGQTYDGSVQPLICGFMFSAALALLLLLRLSRKNNTDAAVEVSL
tara:strand:- start:4363 stop:5601 length:1239 start_codon:yes stop_codon:yes gene_type:complete